MIKWRQHLARSIKDDPGRALPVHDHEAALCIDKQSIDLTSDIELRGVHVELGAEYSKPLRMEGREERDEILHLGAWIFNDAAVQQEP